MTSKTDFTLKKFGLKNTNVRKNIITLFESSKTPVSAGDVLKHIKVNKTTIYREIDTLIKANILVEVNFGDRKKRYELSNLTHHHHLVCIGCRNVSDVYINEQLLENDKLILDANQFRIIRHSLEFFGYCQSCQ